MGNTHVLPSYNFTYLYNYTYKEIFVPDYLLGYPIKANL